jgi:hypothetical protein
MNETSKSTALQNQDGLKRGVNLVRRRSPVKQQFRFLTWAAPKLNVRRAFTPRRLSFFWGIV